MSHLLTLRPVNGDILSDIVDFRNSFIEAGEKHLYGGEGLIHYEDVTKWLADKVYNYSGNILFASYYAERMAGILRVTPSPSEEYIRNGACNIGQSIRPEMRCKGFGTQQLKMGVQLLKMLGVPQPTAHVSKDNFASRRSVSKAGGVCISETESDYVFRF